MKFALSKVFYSVLVVLFCGQVSWAAAPNPPEPPQPSPPVGLDIDSSLAFLIVAALVYGVYVVKSKIKSTKITSNN